jgi:hypothetical protein
MLKNEMKSYVRIGRRGLKNLTYPYMGAGGIKNGQNHPYVINEWPLNVVSGGHLQTNSLDEENRVNVNLQTNTNIEKHSAIR